MNQRASFENWAQENLPADSTKRYQTNPDRYYFVDTDQAWEAWQAAYRQGQIDALMGAADKLDAEHHGIKLGELIRKMAQELKQKRTPDSGEMIGGEDRLPKVG